MNQVLKMYTCLHYFPAGMPTSKKKKETASRELHYRVGITTVRSPRYIRLIETKDTTKEGKFNKKGN